MPNELPLFERLTQHADRVAVIDSLGEVSYERLLEAAGRIASTLLAGRADLEEQRVAFLLPPARDYVAAQWGVWLAGGVAVPLCSLHPRPELEYVLDDAAVSQVIVHPEFEPRLRPLRQERGLKVIVANDLALSPSDAPSECNPPQVDAARRAMILYTSGTTSRPKGVVTTHANIQAQVESLIAAWEWRRDDHILHVLPLHHIHGIINVLTCAMWAGARCELAPAFDAEETWRRFADGRVTLFMAVPTIYAKLIVAWEAANPERRQAYSAACADMRLMVSGSAALPVSMLESWKKISGHVLLERYGMTEIGMALSNPLEGRRAPGCVGGPLPGVEIRLVDEQGGVVSQPDSPGEIEVRGPTVFLEYWRREEATAGAFRDGWFRTGDVASQRDGVYRILGRNSVDIIKTGGYKVSALEIEDILLTHPDIEQCAVVGVDDPEWGQKVSAAVVTTSGDSLSLQSLRAWCKQRLAVYKVPTQLRCVRELPRNAMGKVSKPRISPWFESDQEPA